MRNAYAQTAVPPYAVRPLPGAPVATPIAWEELSDSKLRADRWTVKNVLRRLTRRATRGPTSPRSRAACRGPRKRLEQLMPANSTDPFQPQGMG